METKGFGTFRRYELAERWEYGVEETLKRLERKKFLPLDAAREETERCGWITLEHLFDTQFDLEKVFIDPFLKFGFRVDRRRVPANLVRAHVKIEERAVREATGKPVGAARRREIREQVVEKLLEKVLPAATAYEVVLAPKRGFVWFSNTGEKATELFVAHFEDTFEIALVAQGPRQCALRLSGGDADAVERTAPTCFANDECRMASGKRPQPAAAQVGAD
jgi:DNA recombination-dependent growth factor C